MSSQSTIYRSDQRRHLAARAARVATAVAASLAAIGALAMIAGVAGAFGVASIGPMRAALYVGLGLLAAGAGGLLLLIVRTPREN